MKLGRRAHIFVSFWLLTVNMCLPAEIIEIFDLPFVKIEMTLFV